MVTFGKLGRYGRLGNQMFQIASTIGIARKKGYDVGFPEWLNWDAKERFVTSEDIRVGQWFPIWETVQKVNSELYPEYFIPWGFHGFDIPDNVSLVGHMQSERYFEHCAEEIRHLFSMTDDKLKLPYTAIHVRMGDYGSSYHPICTYDYYKQAIALIDGPYMVFSDNPQEAWTLLKPLMGPSDCLFHGDTRRSFAKMKRCKSHIIANSTFSWWAAWLADADVVAPKQWFGPDAAQLETKDIYPPKWNVI